MLALKKISSARSRYRPSRVSSVSPDMEGAKSIRTASNLHLSRQMVTPAVQSGVTALAISDMPIVRYTGMAQALHWVTVAFVLAVLPLAWVAEALPRGAEKSTVFVIHRSVGLTILLLIAARLAWRARHPPPPEQDGAGRVMAALGQASHWLLYFIFFAMPVTGYLMSGNGKPVSYFGLFSIPGFPKNEALDRCATVLHLAGQWAVYALVLLHVAATVWHVAMRRDGLLSRMLPVQHPRVPDAAAASTRLVGE